MKHRFVVLDGMRGIAAIAVVTLHMKTFFGGAPLARAELAVDFFFALSGFVLAQAYDAKLRSGMSPAAFMRERLIRLYPLYALGTVMGLAAFVLFSRFGNSAPVSPAAYAVSIGSAALFLPSPLPVSPRDVFPLLVPAWSLFFELVANLAFALIATRLTNRVLAALIAGSTLTFVLACYHFGGVGLGPFWDTFIGGLPRVGFGFFVGVALQRIHKAGPVKIKLPPVLLMAALLATMAFPLGLWGQLAVVLLAMPALVLLGAAAEPGPRTSGFFLALGAASYPLYVIHFPIAETVKRALLFLHFDRVATSPVVGLAAIVGLVGVALVLERFYDRPVRAWVARFGFGSARPGKLARASTGTSE